MGKRKFWRRALLAALFLAGGMSPCAARIAPGQAAIGGIGYNADMDYVIGIYGPPDEIRMQSVYCWGMGVEVNTLKTGKAKGVKVVSAANGIATQDGVCVGMDVSVLNQNYGAPDHMDARGRQTVYSYESGRGCLMFVVEDEEIVEIDLVAGYN